MTKIEVIEMAQHFLYLPFYYAKHNAFFEYIDPKYDVELTDAFPRTDEAALKRLLGPISDDTIRFALCDPTPLMDMELDNADPPAVLAVLITNAAIWAVDKDAPTVQAFDELKSFETVIAFEQGTTTFGMARRIVGARTDSKILTVEPGQELTALKKYKNAVALSPDILLAITAAHIGDMPLKIILPIGMTQEYDNVLVTALITRRSVVDKHPELVKGMLCSIQRSILEVNLRSERVLDFASKRFDRNKELISKVLSAANDANVFPPNILVQRNHWDAAALAYCEGVCRAHDTATKEKSHTLYDRLVLPYIELAKSAMQEVVGTAMTGTRRESERLLRAEWLVLASCAGLLLGALALNLVSPRIVECIGFWAMIATLTAILKGPFRAKPRLIGHFVLYLFCIPATLFVIEPTHDVFWRGIVGSFAMIMLGADMTTLSRESAN